MSLRKRRHLESYCLESGDGIERNWLQARAPESHKRKEPSLRVRETQRREGREEAGCWVGDRSSSPQKYLRTFGGRASQYCRSIRNQLYFEQPNVTVWKLHLNSFCKLNLKKRRRKCV